MPQIIRNGGFEKEDRDLRNYFGLRQLPYDFQIIYNLKSENATIKKSHENIKIERNNLFKKNSFLKEDKNKLLKQIENLNAKIKCLEKELSNIEKTVDNSM